VFRNICGEGKSVNEQDVNAWQQSLLPQILQTYQAKDIFNADETGLFYQMLPNKSFHFKNKECIGVKNGKNRLTVMVAANMDGSQKLPLFIIGHAKNPRCFKNVKSLPVEYTANKRAWMTKEIFEGWLKQLDRSFVAERRKVAFVIDNCPAHGNVSGLEAIHLFFLPPNTTSKTQPMDQGVIQNLKLYYRRRLLQQLLVALDCRREYKVSVLDALHSIHMAWKNVSPTTIENCFRHCGFAATTDQQPQVEDNLTAPEPTCDR